MTENLPMSNKNEDRADKAFVQGYKEFFSLNPESLSPEEIKDLNNGAIGKKAKKKQNPFLRSW